MKDRVTPEREREIIIEDGPDKGKRFVINMMSAYTGDRWARKLGAACGRSAGRIPEAVISQGPGAFSDITIAIFGHIEENIREELFDELMKCVKIKRGGAPLPTDVIELDFDDPFTLQRVREEAFDLNVNFIKAAVSQLSQLAATTMFLGGILSLDRSPKAET